MYVNRGKNHFFPIQPADAHLGQKFRKSCPQPGSQASRKGRNRPQKPERALSTSFEKTCKSQTRAGFCKTGFVRPIWSVPSLFTAYRVLCEIGGQSLTWIYLVIKRPRSCPEVPPKLKNTKDPRVFLWPFLAIFADFSRFFRLACYGG